MTEQQQISVLVTGGSHFIGYHIISRILETEPSWHISVLDLPSSLERFPSVTYYNVDVSVKLDVEGALKKIRPCIIFHAACTYDLSLPAATHKRINTQGTLNVLNGAQSLGSVKAFIYHSSSSVVEDGVSDMHRTTESLPVLLPPQQKFPYPISKALAESAVLAANRKYGILTTSLRPAGTFGEADYEMIDRLISNAEVGRAKMQIGDGSNSYDFLYVGNLVDAHILAAKSLLRASSLESKISDEERVDGQAFNITNDEPWLFWDFQREIAKQAGYEVKKSEIRIISRWTAMMLAFVAEWWVWIVSGGKRESGFSRHGIRYACMNRTLSCEKAKRVLEYRPRVGMQEGIERSVRWFAERRGQEKEKEL